MLKTIILFAVAVSLSAAQRFAPEDLWEWRTATDPQISPDGRAVIYLQQWNDRASDAECSNAWLIDEAGNPPRPLARGAWRDRSPRWSPDGKRIAWISDSSGRSQIWIRQLESARDRVIATETEPLAIGWSPGGESIAFTARVPSDAAAPAWAPPAILPRLAGYRPSRVELFVLPAAGGPPRRISRTAHSLAGPPAWMPDGQSILIAADDGILYRAGTPGGDLQPVTEAGLRSSNPVPSPDGSKIAWLARDSHPQSYAVARLYVMNADGSRARVLAGTLDRDAGHPQWSSDSRTIYFTADDHGSTHVYSARNDGSVRQLTTAAEQLAGFSLADNGRAVTVREPGEVIAFSVYSPAEVTRLATLKLDRETGPVEEIHYQSAGYTIQGWLIKPPDFDPARKYPLLLDVQDSPRRMYGFGVGLEPQIFAARGYVVLCANPRGTPGYGEQFGNLLRTRYPGDDADDLLRGVDFVLAKGYVDPARLFVRGGVVAAWLLGQTGRFASAVIRHPIADWVSDVATAPDGHDRALDLMGAMPWDDPDQYVKHSPIFLAKNFKTPTLVIGDGPQADELIFALRERKVESALVRTGPKPSDRLLEIETSLSWFSR